LQTGRELISDDSWEVIKRQMAGEPIPEGLETYEAEVLRQALAPYAEDQPQEETIRWPFCVPDRLTSACSRKLSFANSTLRARTEKTFSQVGHGPGQTVTPGLGLQSAEFPKVKNMPP